MHDYALHELLTLYKVEGMAYGELTSDGITVIAVHQSYCIDELESVFEPQSAFRQEEKAVPFTEIPSVQMDGGIHFVFLSRLTVKVLVREEEVIPCRELGRSSGEEGIILRFRPHLCVPHENVYPPLHVFLSVAKGVRSTWSSHFG